MSWACTSAEEGFAACEDSTNLAQGDASLPSVLRAAALVRKACQSSAIERALPSFSTS